jgi:predicted dehydrogenase/threonine dehydrogenase-like Zn-dependent dehydrogenase
MQQVLQNLNTGETRLELVPAPAFASGKVFIQTTRTLISAGTEKMLVEFGQAGLIGKARAQPEKVKQVLEKIRTDGLLPTLDAVFAKLGEPLPLGYCNAGVVVELGSGVTEFAVGDRVVSNGPHAEFVSVPKLLCAKIPDNVSDEQASFTVLASIGLQGVRLVQPTLGESVVVYGLGLIGLVTVQLLRASGCRVIGVDINDSRLALAAEFGAEVINGKECTNIPAKIMALTDKRGADAVLITASAKTDSIISDSAKACRKRGRIVLVGVIGLQLNRADFYEKELTFQVSCSYGPGRYDSNYEQSGHDYPIGFVRWTEQRNFEAILAMLSSGQLDFSKLITHRFPLEQAPFAYETIQNDSSSLGVVLEYPSDADQSRTVALTNSKSVRRNSKPIDQSSPVLAVVGAGNFTKATMMPVLTQLPARMKYIVGRSGTAAIQHTASKFGVENATTDLDMVLEDHEVNLLMVTTNHDSHANLVSRALNADKHVFVEKPLAINVPQLERVLNSVENAQGKQLLVGFNRRFSPHIQKCRELLRGRANPIAINIVVNAGEIPADHWVHDPILGGGRIIGEACHFLDLAVYLSGSLIRSVAASRFGGNVSVRDDKMTISLQLSDGSIASINYFANGSKSYPKERISVFSDNRILEVDNFRLTKGYGVKGFSKLKTFRQEKGHRQQFSALIDRVTKGGDWLIPQEELTNVTLASIAAMRSAESDRTITIDEMMNELQSSLVAQP